MRCNYILAVISLLITDSALCQEKMGLVATYDYMNREDNKFQVVKLWANSSNAYSEFFILQKSSDTIYEGDFEEVQFSKQSKDTIGQQYFLNGEEITFRDHIYTENRFVPVIVTESQPQFQWKYGKEKMEIVGYQCDLATLSFRGRNYKVWYTEEVPTRFGPWKFYGLPGLMVRIESDDRSIVFQLTKLELSDGKEIRKPTAGKQLTFAEYTKYQALVVDDFVEKLRTKLPRGATVKVKNTEPVTIEKNYD